MREASPYVGLGMQIAGSMVMFVGGGYLLDKWLDTTPWLTIVGAFLGMAAIFIQLVRVSKTLSSKGKKNSSNAEDQGAGKQG